MANSILDKIAKLLALQESRGATEAEAQLACEHVQRLLQEHNLTLSEVEAHGGKSDSLTAARTKVSLRVVKNKRMQWRVRLVEGIAQSQFCLAHSQTYYERESAKFRKRIVLVGRDVNVKSVQMMFEYLEAACVRALRDSGYPMTEGGNYTRDAAYFLEGAAERLSERLAARRAERERESEERARASSDGKSLVLSDVYGTEHDLNNDHLNNFPPGTTAARRRAGEERVARQEAEYARLRAEGVEETVAWYRSHGYSEERAAEAAAEYQRSSARSARRGGRGGSANNWSRSNEEAYRRQTSSAFKRGLATGASIGLDEQVGTAAAPRRIGRR
jgi:hypothetical protein